jgi:putative endonuclease
MRSTAVCIERRWRSSSGHDPLLTRAGGCPSMPLPPLPPRPPTSDRSNLARGRWGENLAAAHYLRLGYELIDRNWRSPSGELDLVLRLGSTYVFCEVKARRTDDYGPATAAVSAAKQRRIRQLGIEWLRAHDLHADAIRFDVVGITGVELVLIENAF